MTDHDFNRELKELINRRSRENVSDTPDYLLAGFLMNCLEAYEGTVTGRAASTHRAPILGDLTVAALDYVQRSDQPARATQPAAAAPPDQPPISHVLMGQIQDNLNDLRDLIGYTGSPKQSAQTAKIAELEKELADIDDLLGNREAFDGLGTRWLKIRKAIAEASRIGPLTADLTRLERMHTEQSNRFTSLVDQVHQISAMREAMTKRIQELEAGPTISTVGNRVGRRVEDEPITGRDVTAECQVLWTARNVGTDQSVKEFRITHYGHETTGKNACRYAFRRRTFFELPHQFQGEIVVRREAFLIDLLPELPPEK